MTIEFRNGTCISGVSPETAARTLQNIYDRDGQLTPAAVVNEARPISSPLHPAFEWSDKVAAEQYRTHQARNIIRAVVIRTSTTATAQPIFVHIPNKNGTTGKYMPVSVVVNCPDLFDAALAELRRLAMAVQESANALMRAANNHEQVQKAASVVRAVTSVIDSLASN